MSKTIKSILCALSLGALLILPSLVSAQTASTSLMGRLNIVAGGGGYNTGPGAPTSAQIIGTVVGAFLGFTGLTFIILIIIAGYGWLTAGGNEEKIKKASSTIKSAIIGVIVAFSAWTLWTFIFEKLILGA